MVLDAHTIDKIVNENPAECRIHKTDKFFDFVDGPSQAAIERSNYERQQRDEEEMRKIKDYYQRKYGGGIS